MPIYDWFKRFGVKMTLGWLQEFVIGSVVMAAGSFLLVGIPTVIIDAVAKLGLLHFLLDEHPVWTSVSAGLFCTANAGMYLVDKHERAIIEGRHYLSAADRPRG